MYKNKKARYVNVHFEWRILALWQQKANATPSKRICETEWGFTTAHWHIAKIHLRGSNEKMCAAYLCFEKRKAHYVNVHFEWWRWGDSPYSDCWRKSNRVQPQGFRHAVHVQLQLCVRSLMTTKKPMPHQAKEFAKRSDGLQRHIGI